MGIYNEHTIQYLLLISDKFGLSEVIKKLQENNLYLQLRRDKNSNERYIILTKLTCKDKRLLDSEYYKDNNSKWIYDYNEKTTKITQNIDIELSDDEKNKLDKILLLMPECIETHGFYNENSISTTYGNTYFATVEYNIIINETCDIDTIKKYIKEICNEFNYQVCDFVKCKYNNELQIKLVNKVQSKNRTFNSDWLKKIVFEEKIYKKRVETDLILSELENKILEKMKILLNDYIVYDGWYLENNIYSDELYFY